MVIVTVLIVLGLIASAVAYPMSVNRLRTIDRPRRTTGRPRRSTNRRPTRRSSLRTSR